MCGCCRQHVDALTYFSPALFSARKVSVNGRQETLPQPVISVHSTNTPPPQPHPHYPFIIICKEPNQRQLFCHSVPESQTVKTQHLCLPCLFLFFFFLVFPSMLVYITPDQKRTECETNCHKKVATVASRVWAS